eukprot:Colp12_sorted_trinity150504_noHs@29065
MALVRVIAILLLVCSAITALPLDTNYTKPDVAVKFKYEEYNGFTYVQQVLETHNELSADDCISICEYKEACAGVARPKLESASCTLFNFMPVRNQRPNDSFQSFKKYPAAKIDYAITRDSKIDGSELVLFYGDSQDCQEACDIRESCSGFVYDRRGHSCSLKSSITKSEIRHDLYADTYTKNSF